MSAIRVPLLTLSSGQRNEALFERQAQQFIFVAEVIVDCSNVASAARVTSRSVAVGEHEGGRTQQCTARVATVVPACSVFCCLIRSRRRAQRMAQSIGFTCAAKADPHPKEHILDNRIEQNHRPIKRRIPSMLSFKSMGCAATILWHRDGSHDAQTTGEIFL